MMVKVYYNVRGRNIAKKIASLLVDANVQCLSVPDDDLLSFVSVYIGATPIATRYKDGWTLLRGEITDPVAKAAAQKTLEILTPVVGTVKTGGCK